MKLFELSFPNSDICERADLYYRSERPFADCLELLNETVDFDTFFNVFSCGKYLRHTVVNNAALYLDVEGDVTVKLFHVDGEAEPHHCWAEGITKKRGTTLLTPQPLPQDALRTVQIGELCDGKTERRTVALPFDFSAHTSGYIYFSVTAQGGAKVFGGYYDAPNVTARDVKVGLVICTFKREAYVKRNVANIQKYLQQNDDLRGKLDVFVVDNGCTLSQSDVQGATLVRNKNLGGSGGFTRGILEVQKRKAYTHVLLSDDDVVYQPSIFRKTISLLQTAKNPHDLAVGAAMLRLDMPGVQHEFGALWNKKYVSQQALNNGYDVTKQAAILKNEQTYDADYSAWWYMCMPLCKVEENGLPLPFFVKIDDIEYGARCKFEIALLNGIGLWHEPFEDKYSAYLEYYNMRNLLVANCLSKRSSGAKMFKWIVIHVALQLVYQRYFTLKYIFDGCNDFFKGAKFLLSADGEMLNKKLIAQNLKMQTKQALEEQGYDLQIFYLPKRKKTFGEVVTLNGQLIPTCFYKKQSRKYRVVDMRKCYPQQFYKVKRVVQYNPVAETGFVTKQKVGKLFSTGFKLVGLSFKMLFRYRSAAKSFRKNREKLTSEENWNRLLEINGESDK